MPAVRVEDVLTLPVVALEDATLRPRPVLGVNTAPSGFEGEGFPVRRAFAGIDRKYLDPFIHMDQMGEVEYAPGEPKGTPWHPHRGFETVTYMIDGTFRHRDSIGGGGLISDGDTQWMTAGSGLLHIEAPPEELVASGGLFQGIQLWVNLPAVDKMIAPRYQDIGREQVTLVTTPDGGTLVRLVAGQLGPYEGPGSTHSPITMIHATLAPGARMELPWNPRYNALAYVLAGRGVAGVDGPTVTTGQLAVFGEGDTVVLSADATQDARTPELEVLLLGGQPINEPVFAYGPFVMNTREEVAQAFEDFQAGRLGTIPPDGY